MKKVSVYNLSKNYATYTNRLLIGKILIGAWNFLYIARFWCADKISPSYIVCITNVTKSFTNDTYREVFCRNIANINRRCYQRTSRALFARIIVDTNTICFGDNNRVVIVAHKAS